MQSTPDIAKLLLTNQHLTATISSNTMKNKCPACGFYHNEKFKYNYYTGAILICPNTGVKIYGTYG